jgi:hypothetical protein
MTMTVLRYQARPERAEEVIHVWIEHDIANPDSLQVVPAFQAFMADLAGRCNVPPVVTAATVVGGYR